MSPFQDRGFSMGQKIPASVVMHYADGRYAIDADKSMDHGIETNILATYVRSSSLDPSLGGSS